MTAYLLWNPPLFSLGSRGIQGCLLRGERQPQKRGGRVKLHKVRLRLLLALGLLSTLALVIGHRSVMAVNGFSNNQELALPQSRRSPILESRSSCSDSSLACASMHKAPCMSRASAACPGASTSIATTPRRTARPVQAAPTPSSTKASPTTAASSICRKAAALITTLTLSELDWAAATWTLL